MLCGKKQEGNLFVKLNCRVHRLKSFWQVCDSSTPPTRMFVTGRFPKKHGDAAGENKQLKILNPNPKNFSLFIKIYYNYFAIS